VIWLQAFVAGWAGAALWHLAVMLWRRRRYVIVTREMVVKHPGVELIDPPVRMPQKEGDANGGMIFLAEQGNVIAMAPGDVCIRPTAGRKYRKLSRRERTLRALAGAIE
jgi:hypothetical protein